MKFNDVIKEIDKEKTFGELKFESYVGESYKRDRDTGEALDDLKGRAYLLRCKIQGDRIKVTLPPETPKREFERGALVDLVEPEIGAVADRGTVNIYVRAKDIVLKGKGGRPAPVPTQNNHQAQADKKD